MIMILIGRSGSGKTAVARILMERYGYSSVRTCTTRKRRDGESEDAYYFMSKEEFEARLQNDEFAEWDRYGDNLYGTLKSSLEEKDRMIAVLTPKGADAIKAVFPEAFIVHVSASMKTCVQRAVERELELDPGKMEAISARACQDYDLYKDPYCDMEALNPGTMRLERLAGNIADAHDKYIAGLMRDAVKETSSVLKESMKELQDYDRKKAEEKENGI